MPADVPAAVTLPVLVPGQQLDPARRAWVAAELGRRYQRGASIAALCAETGYTYGRVHGLLVRAGVRLRGRGGANNRRRAAPLSATASPC
jgi:hypothetical protein